MKNAVFAESNFAISVETFDPPFFFLITFYPNFSIRMQVHEGFEKCGRTFTMKVDGGDKGGDWIKCGLVR